MRNVLGKTVVNLLGETDKLTDQQSEAIGREFVKQQPLIKQLVWKHRSKYGGDYEALFSRATDMLIVAHLKYDPTRSVWQKFIYHQIRLGLLNLRLETLRRKHAEYTNADDKFQFLPSLTGSNASEVNEVLEDLMHNLTHDARLFLDYTQRDTESKSRREMFGKFREEMLAKGWSRNRIKAATGEVCDMLQWMISEENE